MPIYTDCPCNDGAMPPGPSLLSSLGVNPKITKAIDAATRDWLDKHPEATTTVEDDSITNLKLKDGSVNSRTIEDESVTTDDIADLAVTTSKIADNAVNALKVASSAADGLRTMSTTQPGVAKVGAGLAIDNGFLELDGNGDIATAVRTWLNAHPEATTTVQDNSITDQKLADDQVLYTIAAAADAAAGAKNLMKRVAIGDEVSLTFDDGFSGTANSDITASPQWIHSQMIPVSIDEVFTFVNLMPDILRFVIRGYDSSGTFVSGPTTILNDKLEATSESTSGWSNALNGVHDNSVVTFRVRTQTVTHMCINVQRVNLTPSVTPLNYDATIKDMAKHACFLLRGPISVGQDVIDTQWGEISALDPFVIDTTEKTIAHGTYTIRYGKKRINNPAIDISGLDISAHQHFVFDTTDSTIKMMSTAALQNSIRRYVILGWNWPANSVYPNGYYYLHGVRTYVNGCLLPDYDLSTRNRLGGKKAVLFGDSICQGQRGARYENTPYNLELFVEHDLGMPCDNEGIGGTGYRMRHSSTDDNLSDVMKGYDFTNCGLIVLFAGTNDWGNGVPLGSVSDAASDDTAASFCAWVRYTIEYAFSQAPTAMMAIVTPIFRSYHGSGTVGDAYKIPNQDGHTLGEYTDALVEIAKDYNVPVLNSQEHSAINKLNYHNLLTHEPSGGITERYIHPNNTGYIAMNTKIVRFLGTVI